MTTNIRSKINELEKLVSNLKMNGMTNPLDLELKVLDMMPEIYDQYPSLVKRLVKDEVQDNTYLFKMLNLLDEVAEGTNTIGNIEKSLGDELAQKFLFPIITDLNQTKPSPIITQLDTVVEDVEN